MGGTTNDPTLPQKEVLQEARGAKAAGQAALQSLVEHEPQRHPLILALAAPLGTPLEPIVSALEQSIRRYAYQPRRVHIAQLLDRVKYQPWGTLPERNQAEYYEKRMDAGDALRRDVGNGSALAALAVAEIAGYRGSHGLEIAFILHSLKHPHEVELLRHVYGGAFSLIGVVSSLEERRDNLMDKLAPFGNSRVTAEKLIERDEFDASRSDFGQQVRDVYALADVYLAAGRGLESGGDVDRFVDSLFMSPYITPSPEEEGMRLAFDASLRSAAVGRQVGAALIPVIGTPVIVGTNEVPKPGGGQYWTGDVPDFRDFQTGVDPNPAYTGLVVQELLERLATHGWLRTELQGLPAHELYSRAASKNPAGTSILDGTRARALIEFTRCLHAEQAAIVNAARGGVATQGGTLYTTTFPCHECAKMIVGAGIVKVVYIEPYPKSMVGKLYRDLIDVAPSMPHKSGLINEKVPFTPFVGIAPRRYAKAFRAASRDHAGGEVVPFDRLVAKPRASGWAEVAVLQREDATIEAIDRVIEVLAGELASPSSEPSEGGASATVEQVVGSSEEPGSMPGATA